MQPQPEVLSSDQPSQDASAAVAPSEPVESGSRTTAFLQRLWRRKDGRFAGAQGDQAEETQPPAQTSAPITLTQEELDKRIQAETDRRESKRTEAAKSERRRKLRDEDPWAFAEEERNAEKAAEIDAQNTQWMGNVGATHDRYTVDPVVLSLPETERARILALEGAGVGLDGRKLIVTEGLKALEKHWRAEGAKDAETRLRRNPAFRKQVLGEFRRGMPEPEFIGSGPSSGSDGSVSDILRQQIQARH